MTFAVSNAQPNAPLQQRSQLGEIARSAAVQELALRNDEYIGRRFRTEHTTDRFPVEPRHIRVRDRRAGPGLLLQNGAVELTERHRR